MGPTWAQFRILSFCRAVLFLCPVVSYSCWIHINSFIFCFFHHCGPGDNSIKPFSVSSNNISKKVYLIDTLLLLLSFAPFPYQSTARPPIPQEVSFSSLFTSPLSLLLGPKCLSP
ncbi:MAG: hypothetical protein J3R72DRAFT_435130 [Linnemannia gamsii]|nr:MAG: hypothetical protein J3R72DRAFT_435130 [Linnemannia gamsii]